MPKRNATGRAVSRGHSEGTAGESVGLSPAVPSAAERRLTCVHEAGHAVAEIVFGRAVEYVSIRAGKHFGGIEVPVRHERPEADRFAPWHPVCMQPPELRADIERSIIVLLAGQLAALYLTPPQTSYVDEPEVEEIARRALDNLGPRIAELVVALEESDGPFDDDDTKAMGLAGALAGPQAGVFYLAWLRAEASELVMRYQAAIRRVADGLERHAVLRGEQVAALVYPTKPERS